jgi:hypothetical protein
MKDLVQKINAAANIIHQKSVRGGGNYMVTSPEVAEYIHKANLKYQRKEKLKEIFKNEKI